MFRYFIIFCLYSHVIGYVVPKNSYDNSDQRIALGLAARIYNMPYHVAMLRLPGTTLIYTCGGALIKPDRIISTAFCANKTTTSVWRARAESDEWKTNGQLVEISKLVIHNMYGQTSNQNDYDISIFFTSTPFDMNSPNISTIPISYQTQSFPDGAKGVVTGFGATRVDGTISDYLRYTNMSLMGQSSCEVRYGSRLTERMICFGNYSSEGEGPCQSDEGGPIVVDGILVGVYSWNPTCVNKNYPSVFTRLSSFRSWIDILGQ